MFLSLLCIRQYDLQVPLITFDLYPTSKPFLIFFVPNGTKISATWSDNISTIPKPVFYLIFFVLAERAPQVVLCVAR